MQLNRTLWLTFLLGFAFGGIIAGITGLAGCAALRNSLAHTPPEQTARNVIAVATGAISQAQVDYKDECQKSPGKSECILINQAVYAQNATITSLEIYCTMPVVQGVPGTDVKCAPISSALGGLQSAVAHLNDLIGQVNAITRARGKHARLGFKPVKPVKAPLPVPVPLQADLTGGAISLALLGLKLLLDKLLAGKAAGEIADEAITATQSAIVELEKVQGTDVTLQQLEALRLHTMWPDPGTEQNPTEQPGPTST
jgi:hypothetical protein